MTETPLHRNRDFVLLQTGLLLSSAGSQMTSIAYPLLVLALTGSAAKAGIVAFVRLLAMAVFATMALVGRNLMTLLTGAVEEISNATAP